MADTVAYVLWYLMDSCPVMHPEPLQQGRKCIRLQMTRGGGKGEGERRKEAVARGRKRWWNEEEGGREDGQGGRRLVERKKERGRGVEEEGRGRKEGRRGEEGEFLTATPETKEMRPQQEAT